MTDPTCVFCNIVAGDAPAHKVYEDEHNLAFLDIHPLADFHTLLIPKHHVARMEDCDDGSAAALGVAVKRVSRIIHKLTGNKDFNVFLANGQHAGQEVWHSHYHFIPREGRQDGLGYRWKTGRLPSQDRINDFCRKALSFFAYAGGTSIYREGVDMSRGSS